MAFEVGTRAGKFELLEQLGAGGFGLVFRARDLALGRDCAVKFLRPEHIGNAEHVQRFLQEARAAARIQHPGIVTVFECGQFPLTGSAADGMIYLSMELLRGEPLSARLQRGPLSVAAAAAIARQIAAAVEAAHQAGIVHRDLKPENVYLVPDPETVSGERVKVLDFGIAKLGEGGAGAVQTGAHLILGSPRYMSPEQCRATARVDARTDVYSLGAMLLEMLSGAPPFVDPDSSGLMAQHQLVPAPRLSARVPGAPAELDALIASMLAKAPDARPQTMAEVERALAPFRAGAASGGGPAVATPGGGPVVVAPAAPRPPGAVPPTERVLTRAAPAARGARPSAAPPPMVEGPASSLATTSARPSRGRPSRARRWALSFVIAGAALSAVTALWTRCSGARRGAPAVTAQTPVAQLAVAGLPTPEALRADHRAAVARGAAGPLVAALAPDAFAMGPDADELAYGARAAGALIEAHIDRIPIGPRDAPIGRAGDVAWWIEIGRDRQIASSTIAVASGPRWQIAAWKLAYLVPNATAAKLAAAGRLSAPALLVRDADPAPAALAAELALREALSSRAAFIAAFSTRGDAVATGTAPGELMIGGGVVRAAFSRFRSELRLLGDVRVGRLAERAAWAAASVEYSQGALTPQIFRVLALLLQEGDRWTIAMAHFSNAGPIGRP